MEESSGSEELRGAACAQNLTKPTHPGTAIVSEAATENTLSPISQGESQAEVSESATSISHWLSTRLPFFKLTVRPEAIL